MRDVVRRVRVVLSSAAWIAAVALTSCTPDRPDEPAPARVTVALAHDAATAESDEWVEVTFVRRPDGHASYDGIVTLPSRPAEVEIDPGTYALFAQSMRETKCAIEHLSVVAGEERHLDLHLGPARRVSVELGQTASAMESSHFVVAQDGVAIFVRGTGWLSEGLVLPDCDLDFEVHSEGCTSVTRAALPRGADRLQIP